METRFAFFIELKKNAVTLEGADLDIGNPGIGGTQFLFLLTVKYLNEIFGDKYAVLLTDTTFDSLDKSIPYYNVGSPEDGIHFCEKNKINKIVFCGNIVENLNSYCLKSKVEIILWAHNTLTPKRQKIAANEKNIKWVICVSESQYKNMIDTPCFYKCTYINNIIPKSFYSKAQLTNYFDNKVVYIGSIMPQKGVHNLLEIWKFVEKISPETQLYIFGGAKVWNVETALGKNGIADPYYDKIIEKRLNRLSNPDNIHFIGAKGWDYINSFVSTFRLGIVNPSHYMRDETFCLSAIEMEAHGLPVISRMRNDGLSTTIIQGYNGFLEKNDYSIAKRIVEVVNDPVLCRNLGENSRKYSERFIAELAIHKWKELDEGKLERVGKSTKRIIPRDSFYLAHDMILKYGFLFESKKGFDLLKKKIRKK